MGVTAPAPTEPPAKEKTFQRLGDLLVKKVITSEQLEQATKFQNKHQHPARIGAREIGLPLG